MRRIGTLLWLIRCAGVMGIGAWLALMWTARHPMTLIVPRVEHRIDHVQPADYAPLKARVAELQSELDLARAAAVCVQKDGRPAGDEVARWLNEGVYRGLHPRN